MDGPSPSPAPEPRPRPKSKPASGMAILSLLCSSFFFILLVVMMRLNSTIRNVGTLRRGRLSVRLI